MKKTTIILATLFSALISVNSIAQTKFIADDGLNSSKENSISFEKSANAGEELTYVVNPNESSIKWSTAKETNMSHFELQVSSDGETFTELKKVAASDYTQWQTDYKVSFRKNYLSVFKVYYRVKAVFSDNSFTYSSPVVFEVVNNGKQVSYASLH